MHSTLSLTLLALVFPLTSALAQTAPALPATAVAPGLPADHSAQVIKGQVIDEDGQPLPGATIIIKGTRHVCSTNADGVFSLPSAHPSEQVRVSLLGYTEADMAVRSGTANAVTLQLLPGTRIKHGGRHNGKLLAVGRAEE
ncbi:carboxypeptidase-like regulatory domain-containing protein [Hymenobacter jeollabukensis]|uniref:Carboxypeptidase-like regulatory domain-containing protein n=1 Tax=Hymenobacter jeollabukensis TaxID=2025313 RepID=A0A5R8WSY9_9BACT|nr:carboxypeptidase-like regulatory domain-containing protein [Hymenobacter jeollabukensis]TLM93917.1 carboxypeptidase-like regulatory domain-containing protein [Hymenobacter jeollabukensis]